MYQPTPDPARLHPPKGWWNRIGATGQVSLLVALIGLLGTAITGIATGGFTSANHGGGGTLTPVTSTNTTGQTTTVVSTTSTGPTTTAPAEIIFTISDQLTQGAAEELISVSLEGNKVAMLRADAENPIVTRSVTATTAGNYSYIVDGTIWWFDQFGALRETVATGRGSVHVSHGDRLDVYVHLTTDGRVDLSLQKAG